MSTANAWERYGSAEGRGMGTPEGEMQRVFRRGGGGSACLYAGLFCVGARGMLGNGGQRAGRDRTQGAAGAGLGAAAACCPQGIGLGCLHQLGGPQTAAGHESAARRHISGRSVTLGRVGCRQEQGDAAPRGRGGGAGGSKQQQLPSDAPSGPQQPWRMATHSMRVTAPQLCT